MPALACEKVTCDLGLGGDFCRLIRFPPIEITQHDKEFYMLYPEYDKYSGIFVFITVVPLFVLNRIQYIQNTLGFLANLIPWGGNTLVHLRKRLSYDVYVLLFLWRDTRVRHINTEKSKGQILMEGI